MIKTIVIYLITFSALSFIGLNLHKLFIQNNEIALFFSLEKIYLFHAGFSILVCVNLVVLSTVNKFFEQLGFIYLGSIFLKLILFSVIFYKPLFIDENLPFNARLSLLFPTIIFLLTEAFFVSKILNQKQ